MVLRIWSGLRKEAVPGSGPSGPDAPLPEMPLPAAPAACTPASAPRDIATAYHEAAHTALVLHCEDQGFRLTGFPTLHAGAGGGSTPWDAGPLVDRIQSLPSGAQRIAALRSLLQVMFSGGLAEVRKTGDGDAAEPGIQADMMLAADWVKYAAPDADYHAEVQPLLAEVNREADALVTRLWPKIVAIADTLLVHGAISPQQARSAFDGAGAAVS